MAFSTSESGNLTLQLMGKILKKFSTFLNFLHPQVILQLILLTLASYVDYCNNILISFLTSLQLILVNIIQSMSFLCSLSLMASQFTNIKFLGLAELLNFIGCHSPLSFTQTQWPFCNASNTPGWLTPGGFLLAKWRGIACFCLCGLSFPFLQNT